MKTTNSMFELFDDNEMVLDLKNKDIIFIDCHEDSDDGTFPRLSDYVRRIKLLDNGTYTYLNWIGKKLKIKMEGYVIKRKSLHSAEATLIFDKPVILRHSFLANIPIEITEIEGEFYHEFYIKSNAIQTKYPNGFEIYFRPDKFKLLNDPNERKYNVVKVMKKTLNKKVLHRNLTLKEAQTMVKSYPNSQNSMVYFTEK